MKKPLGYQDGLAGLLGLTFGIVMLDRGAINFLAPFIVQDLKLTNAQLGIASSIVAVTWATAGYLVGRISDASGRRKPYLVFAVVLFSLCSIASGFAAGFVMLVTARLLMGLGEGPVPALSTALIFDASSPDRRGLNYGLFAFFTGLVGNVFAPVVIVALATWFDWRVAFMLAGVPGLVAAAAIAVYVRETPASIVPAPGFSQSKSASRLADILRVRNIWLSALIASLLLAFFADLFVFLPLLLVRELKLLPGAMGVVMAVVGAVILFGGLALPALSDRWGRKTVLVTCAPLGVALPLACLFGAGGFAGLVALCALAGLVAALPFLAIAIVPAESASARDRGAAVGLVMGTAEILGGFVAPAITGVVADQTSLLAAPIIAGTCAVAASLLSLCLEETAPRRIARSPIGSPTRAALLSD